MKRIIVLAISLFFGASGQASETVRIVVDDAHLHMERSSEPEPLNYELSAGSKIEIDAVNYKFRLPEKLEGKRPNSVQLVIADQKQYSAPWPDTENLVVLSKGNLSPNPGSLPFEGLGTGDNGIVAIGVLEGASFYVVWIGMFTVK